ncbi:MAG: holo-ACP synthase [Verrucomicrobiae bacterium]|nr:holo-ACP synthase [Verrucomicrobiae bacterium]
MIFGVGMDLIETSRIEASWKRFGKRFLARVFLPEEIAYCLSMKFPARHLAARFAAKEAVSKAFGTGIGAQLGWKDIEVRRDPNGRPFLLLHGGGERLFRECGATRAHLSLTHHETAAAAVAVLEC